MKENQTIESLTKLLKDVNCPSITAEVLLTNGFQTLHDINSALKLDNLFPLINMGFKYGDIIRLKNYLKNKESDLKFTAPCTPLSIYKSLSIHPKSVKIIANDKEGEEKYIREDQQMKPGEYHIVEVHDSFSVKLLWWKKEIQISEIETKPLMKTILEIFGFPHVNPSKVSLIGPDQKDFSSSLSAGSLTNCVLRSQNEKTLIRF
ncbi:hypothetical protein PPL_11347 [Heterostelium album PN500]|uniref:Uncharacterized protein n=1 Tax=Heterostelium pallidum (strain ATCC 26659 / Pp 5 / PN500) TaxID=670386 RepID=D3BT55_HETP5|nr:hypothetical protein PPL_11347 [Heterostelium album PN500]EFA75272.1 hypothetical protein PPL_11347 [Heterostelium album PN500]|eukprot:XP_020427406.1 hypothetical protein PPL_11347 [Heterostelium album PN500]